MPYHHIYFQSVGKGSQDHRETWRRAINQKVSSYCSSEFSSRSHLEDEAHCQNGEQKSSPKFEISMSGGGELHVNIISNFL